MPEPSPPLRLSRRPRVLSLSSISSDEEASTYFTEKEQVEWEDIPEAYQNDDACEEGVEITEGGWICRVEHFRKRVDRRGHVHLRQLRKERSSRAWDQDMADAHKPDGLKPEQMEKNVGQSIISCIHHTTRSRHRGFFESETYIEIESPLILEVLRKNTSYEQQV